MKKKLLIVESPTKIKTISKFLDKNFTILATMGHIKDLPSKKLGVTLKGKSAVLDYEILPKKDKVIADICKEAKRSSAVFLAPDPDREGELIAWHVQQEILRCTKLHENDIHRITYNEITKSAIESALEHPATIDINKVNAQQARRTLDRWVGYEVSPILWRKIAKGLSAGRVQSVALRLICDREEAIRSFVPEESWTIHGLFQLNKKETIKALLTHHNKKKVSLKTNADVQKLIPSVQNGTYAISSIKDSQRLKNPFAPFMTSTLQQSAYNQLGFSVDKTMLLAQKLYEGLPLQDPQTPIALITYMRTDSVRIATSALKEVQSFIVKNYTKDYLPAKAHVYAKKATGQDAHEAIRPIDVAVTPEIAGRYLDSAAASLYTLIWKRFVASQMKAATYLQRQVLIEGNGCTFKATGSTLLFDGFLKVYSEPDGEDTDQEEILPKNLVADTKLVLESLMPKQHFTQPPPRFTQASLVKELEKEGIGRPSTYATILKTIQARAYTKLEKKKFIPTELGMAVTKLLTENLPDIMNTKFTAVMEESLDKIAQGEVSRDELLFAFYKPFIQQLEIFQGESVKRPTEQTELICPTCSKEKLVIRFGKAGPFLSCPSYPDCTFTSNFERLDDGSIRIIRQPEPELLDEQCPLCQKQLRKMVGRYGPFVACSGYPECKYIKQTIASFPCPQSGGNLIRRQWKGKIFWGCSDYPTCKFTISGDIEERPCSFCKSPYFLKKETSQESELVCPNKECPSRTSKSIS